MQAEVGVVVAVAVLDDDVVANLPTDAVAVVVASLDAAYRHAVAILQEDAAGVIAIEVIVFLAVAVERDVLDQAVADELAADQRE